MKLLAWVPAPIVFGKLFQSTCLVKNSHGNCVFHDNDKVRNFQYGILFWISLFYCIVSVIFYFIFVRRLKSKKPMWGGMDTEKPF